MYRRYQNRVEKRAQFIALVCNMARTLAAEPARRKRFVRAGPFHRFGCGKLSSDHERLHGANKFLLAGPMLD
jgi:hypothetical protein